MADWFKIASITTTGSAGTATGTSGKVSRDLDNNKPLPHGLVVSYFIDFTTMPATTDVTISRVEPNGALKTALTVTNSGTDAEYPVKEPSYSNAGVASAVDLIYPFTPNGTFQVDVAQGDAITNGVVVWVAIE